MNIYESCPVLENEKFILAKVFADMYGVTPLEFRRLSK